MGKLLKPLDAWTEVIISDPLTNPIAVRLAKISSIHPLQITLVGVLLKFAASIIFLTSPMLTEHYTFPLPLLSIPPILFFMGILADSIDGKVARLTGKDVELHGTLDFISDQIVNSIYFLSMVILFLETSYTRWMIVWYILLYLTMSIASTRNRLLSALGGIDTDRTSDLRAMYEKAMPLVMKGRIAGALYKRYTSFLDKTLRHRLYTHPTGVDSELIFFVVFPLFASLYPSVAVYFLAASVILLIPDLIYYAIITMAILKQVIIRNRSESY